jgi:aspartyl-tRNA(Asn)/glutamyl-tRNA(Gln) amidotransferase subunit A
MLNQYPASQLRELLNKREISNREIIEAVLGQIEAIDASVNAFLTVRDREHLLEEADAFDRARLRGETVGPLAGLPVAIKDNICTAGLRTTCASKILGAYIPPYDATVITKILRAGGILIGKTNMDEFAMGSSTENSAFKVTRNPHNLDYVPGGTSGGSAAAVAAHEVTLAIGSDTGGSVRLPASYCGVVGLKPTYGRVSRYGLIGYGSSLDQIGTLTKTVDDAELLFSVILGRDKLDATSVADDLIPMDSRDKKQVIGVPKEYFIEGIDEEVRDAAERTIKFLEATGCEIIPISLPHTKYAVPTYYIIASAEASSNLARFSGLLYGYRTPSYTGLRDLIKKTRNEGFGPEVRRRILLGTFVLSGGYYDAYYTKANQVRTLIRQDFDNAFKLCDVLLSPVAPTPAFKIGEKTVDPMQMYLVDIFSVTANLTGLPAVSVPTGKTKTGLPLSVQLTGRRFSEESLLKTARLIERAWIPLTNARSN